MPIADSDPRVFFAAERTLLAWLRTGLTIIALGFVVSRFGLFMRMLTLQAQVSATTGTSLSAVLGVAFVIAGTLCIVVAAIQHRRFVGTLPRSDLPKSYSTALALWLSFFVAGLGASLACYLSFAKT